MQQHHCHATPTWLNKCCQARCIERPALSVHRHTFVIGCKQGPLTQAALCSVFLQADCFLADGTNPVCMNSCVVMQHCVAHVHSVLSSCQCPAELRAPWIREAQYDSLLLLSDFLPLSPNNLLFV